MVLQAKFTLIMLILHKEVDHAMLALVAQMDPEQPLADNPPLSNHNLETEYGPRSLEKEVYSNHTAAKEEKLLLRNKFSTWHFLKYFIYEAIIHHFSRRQPKIPITIFFYFFLILSCSI